MTKQDILSLFDNEGIELAEDQIGNLANAVYNLMRDIGHEIETRDPDAINTYGRVYDAASTVESFILEVAGLNEDE